MARNKGKISRKTKRKHLKKRRKSKKRGGIKFGCDWNHELDDKIVCEIGKVIREQQAYKEDYDKQQTNRSKVIKETDIDSLNLEKISERIKPDNTTSYIEKNKKLAFFLVKKLEDFLLSNEIIINRNETFVDYFLKINNMHVDHDEKLSKLTQFNKDASERIIKKLNEKEELNKKEKELIKKLKKLNEKEELNEKEKELIRETKRIK